MPLAKEWKVTHYDHAGNALGECAPNNLSFTIELDNTGIISYDLDLSHPLAVYGNTYPYLTDWVLAYGSTNLMGGEHVSVKISDIEGHGLSINGKDWSGYFDTRWYPYDPSSSTVQGYTPAANADVFTIVEAMFTAAMGLSDSLIVTYPGGSNGLSGQTSAQYKIDAGDTESILSKTKALSQITPGFDYEFTWDKQLKLYAPKKGVTQAIVFEQGRNIEMLDYTNNGIKGTHTMGLGQGTSARIAVAVDSPLAGSYRRRDASADFSSISDLTTLTSLTNAEADRNSHPVEQFQVKYVPTNGEDFFGSISVGDSARVIVNNTWYNIDAVKRLVSIQGDATDEGDTELTLTFDDPTLSL